MIYTRNKHIYIQIGTHIQRNTHPENATLAGQKNVSVPRHRPKSQLESPPADSILLSNSSQSPVVWNFVIGFLTFSPLHFLEFWSSHRRRHRHHISQTCVRFCFYSGLMNMFILFFRCLTISWWRLFVHLVCRHYCILDTNVVPNMV